MGVDLQRVGLAVIEFVGLIPGPATPKALLIVVLSDAEAAIRQDVVEIGQGRFIILPADAEGETLGMSGILQGAVDRVWQIVIR